MSPKKKATKTTKKTIQKSKERIVEYKDGDDRRGGGDHVEAFIMLCGEMKAQFVKIDNKKVNFLPLNATKF